MLKHQSDFRLLVRPLSGTHIHKPLMYNKNSDFSVMWSNSALNDTQKTLDVVLPDHIGVVKLLQPFQQSYFSDCGDWEAILVRLDTHGL